MSSDIETLTQKAALAKDAKKINELMCLAAVIIFPTFAFFDLYTIPNELYSPLTSVRFLISGIIGIWLFIQKKYATNTTYLNYFAFASISWFCAYVSIAGGQRYLYQHNIAYCTVFLAASMFLLWHWKHSIVIVLSSIAVYLFSVYTTDTVSLTESLINGGSVLLTIMVLHPVIILYRYKASLREFLLKKALEESNTLLSSKNKEVELHNAELVLAREKLNETNIALQSANLNLKNLVVTRTNRLEETHSDLKEAERELDQFLYASYHDLKGPIIRLKGIAQLALIDTEDLKAKKYHQLTLDTVYDMESLMAKLNNVATIYHHKLQKEIISLDLFFQTIVLHYNDTNNVSIELQIPSNATLSTDSNLLRPVVQNLIENSLLYRMESGEHKIIISHKKAEGKTVFSIWDNGCGIPETVLPSIFNMFYRGNTQSKGHGLGLYLAKKAVEKLNGTISVSSNEGLFTEFNIVLEE